jgi:nucleoside-diphosphate-sugar epimerase
MVASVSPSALRERAQVTRLIQRGSAWGAPALAYGEQMRILILGGGTFVGRALVESALAAGDVVTTLTRSTPPPGAGRDGLEALFGDRTTPAGLALLAGRDWDAVFDTWSGAPRVVRQSVAALQGRVPYCGYVSSCSVYREPIPAGSDESHPAVDAEPTADLTNYPADKRGSELAVLEGFGARDCLLARAGLILGPYEGPGRLPWWLNRIAHGGDVLAPGPAERPRQFVDARDLADWMLRCARDRTSGAFNAISELGHLNMAALLESCLAVTGAAANLVWVDPEFVLAQQIEPWTELPIWLPPGPDLDGHSLDTRRAAAAGLVCRPLLETVRDTWRWLSAGGVPRAPAGRAAVGLDVAKERAALAAWAARSGK